MRFIRYARVSQACQEPFDQVFKPLPVRRCYTTHRDVRDVRESHKGYVTYAQYSSLMIATAIETGLDRSSAPSPLRYIIADHA